jgi:hypothetical protein
MSIELMGITVSLIIALIGTYSAYKKESKRGQRFGVVIAAVFTIVGAFIGYEQYVRTKSMAAFAQEVDRKWDALQDAYVEAIEFEMVLPDGQVHLPALLDNAQGVRFQVDGVDFHLGVEDAGQNAIELSRIISMDNLSRNGRLGIVEFNVALSKDEKTIEKIKEADCFASKFITQHILAQRANNQTEDEVCSATVIFPVPANTLRLKTVFGSPKISLTSNDPKKLSCLGICKEGLVVSIKLLFRDVGPMSRTAIEVSPFLYLAEPSIVNEQSKTVDYELSGDSISKLARSHFLQSFGYRNQDHFPITQGAIDYLLRTFTTRKATMELVDVTWTTDPSPSKESLSNTVAPEKRASLTPIRVGEWCGFGNLTFCWYVYDMFEARPE